MTKLEAMSLLNCNVKGLAAILKISESAVSQWDDEAIPLSREYQILDIANGRVPLGVPTRNNVAQECLENNI